MPKLVAILLLLLTSNLLATEEGVTINRAAPQVEHRRFDPNTPPADMPPLEAGGAAITHSEFQIQAALSVEIIPRDNPGPKTVAKIKVLSETVDLSLKIVVWLPREATKVIVDHEEGHRQICEYFYKDAGKIARTIAQKYVGQVYEGEGRDANSAAKAAMEKVINQVTQKYMAETQNLSARANEIFDELTQHSRNQKISVEKAVKDSIDRAKKEKEKK